MSTTTSGCTAPSSHSFDDEWEQVPKTSHLHDFDGWENVPNSTPLPGIDASKPSTTASGFSEDSSNTSITKLSALQDVLISLIIHIDPLSAHRVAGRAAVFKNIKSALYDHDLCPSEIVTYIRRAPRHGLPTGDELTKLKELYSARGMGGKQYGVKRPVALNLTEEVLGLCVDVYLDIDTNGEHESIGKGKQPENKVLKPTAEFMMHATPSLASTSPKDNSTVNTSIDNVRPATTKFTNDEAPKSLRPALSSQAKEQKFNRDFEAWKDLVLGRPSAARDDAPKPTLPASYHPAKLQGCVPPLKSGLPPNNIPPSRAKGPSIPPKTPTVSSLEEQCKPIAETMAAGFAREAAPGRNAHPLDNIISFVPPPSFKVGSLLPTAPSRPVKMLQDQNKSLLGNGQATPSTTTSGLEQNPFHKIISHKIVSHISPHTTNGASFWPTRSNGDAGPSNQHTKTLLNQIYAIPPPTAGGVENHPPTNLAPSLPQPPSKRLFPFPNTNRPEAQWSSASKRPTVGKDDAAASIALTPTQKFETALTDHVSSRVSSGTTTSTGFATASASSRHLALPTGAATGAAPAARTQPPALPIFKHATFLRRGNDGELPHLAKILLATFLSLTVILLCQHDADAVCAAFDGIVGPPLTYAVWVVGCFWYSVWWVISAPFVVLGYFGSMLGGLAKLGAVVQHPAAAVVEVPTLLIPAMQETIQTWHTISSQKGKGDQNEASLHLSTQASADSATGVRYKSVHSIGKGMTFEILSDYPFTRHNNSLPHADRCEFFVKSFGLYWEEEMGEKKDEGEGGRFDLELGNDIARALVRHCK